MKCEREYQEEKKEQRKGQIKEEKEGAVPQKYLFISLSFFHNPFVTLFYMGNIIGQRINQCI